MMPPRRVVAGDAERFAGLRGTAPGGAFASDGGAPPERAASRLVPVPARPVQRQPLPDPAGAGLAGGGPVVGDGEVFHGDHGGVGCDVLRACAAECGEQVQVAGVGAGAVLVGLFGLAAVPARVDRLLLRGIHQGPSCGQSSGASPPSCAASQLRRAGGSPGSATQRDGTGSSPKPFTRSPRGAARSRPALRARPWTRRPASGPVPACCAAARARASRGPR